MKRNLCVILVLIFMLMVTNCYAEGEPIFIWDIPFGTPSEQARDKMAEVLGRDVELKTLKDGNKYIAMDIDSSVPTLVAGYQLSEIWGYFNYYDGFFVGNPKNDTVNNETDGLTVLGLKWSFICDATTPDDYGLNVFLGIVNQFTSQNGGSPIYYASGFFSDNIHYCPASKTDGTIDLDIANDVISRSKKGGNYSLMAMNSNVRFNLSYYHDTVISVSMTEQYYTPEINQTTIGDYWWSAPDYCAKTKVRKSRQSA